MCYAWPALPEPGATPGSRDGGRTLRWAGLMVCMSDVVFSLT